MLPTSVYSYVWRTSRREQIRICLLIGIIAPLSMAPLELQRRIVEHALARHEIEFLLLLGSIYLGVILVQGGLKYVLNIIKGRVLEEVVRDLRERIVRMNPGEGARTVDEGTTTSMLAAESEDVGGFASESVAVPLLQVGTIVWVMGYLIWVEPPIAALAVLIYAPQVFLVPRIQTRINRFSRKRISLVRALGRDAVNLDGLTRFELARRRTHSHILIQQILRLRMLIYRHKFFLTFLGNFLDALGPIVVLVAGGYLVIRSETEVSTLVVFISGFQRISDPWDQLVSFYRSVSNARVSYRLMADALDGVRSPGCEAAR